MNNAEYLINQEYFDEITAQEQWAWEVDEVQFLAQLTEALNKEESIIVNKIS